MKKIAPVIAVVVLAAALAVLVYYATRTTEPMDPPLDNSFVPKNATFEAEDLMLVFDEDGDGRITFAEFDARYGKSEDGDAPILFHTGDGTKPLSAKDAFQSWDRNRNGLIDADDIKTLGDAEWMRNAEGLKRRGLHAIAWNGKQLGLNDHQKRTFETETGALARGELPFAGAFWAPIYLAGRWSRVTDPREGETFGFVAERNGKIYVLTAKAELIVKDPAKVEVTGVAADDPHMLYAAEISKTQFDDPAKNLALARKCVEWGFKVEAGMLYARVLVFDQGNQEALDALGYRLDGVKFVSKG